MAGYTMGDIIYAEDVFRIVGATKPDVIMHLAADVSRMSCEESPYRAIDTNLVGTLNVIKAALANDAGLVYVSTSEIYGSAFADGREVDEKTPPGDFNGIYGMTKWQGEEYVRYHAERYGLRAAIARPFMGYGPFDMPSDYRSAVTRFILAFIKGEQPEVHQDTVRQWCYADDFALGEIAVMERSKSLNSGGEPDVYNIGHPEIWDTVKVAMLVRKMMNADHIPIKAVPCPPNIIPKKVGSFAKAKQELGFEAKTGLHEGLQETIRWCWENWKLK